MAEPPQWPTGPRYTDEAEAEAAKALDPAPAPSARQSFPLSVVLVPLLGAIAICIAAIAIVLSLISFSDGWSGTEGDGLAVVALVVISFGAIGPAAFVALLTWMMRRNDRDKPALLGVVTTLGLLPALVIGGGGIAKYTQNRGLRTTGLVVVLVLIVLALTWILAAMGRQPLRIAMLGTLVAAGVLVFTIVAANLNADAYDRALEREAISGQNAPLALFDTRGARTESNGWRIVRVDSIHVNRSHQYGSLGLALENLAGQTVTVDFTSTEKGGYCGATTSCQRLTTLDDGTVIQGKLEAFGSRFDYPAPRGQGWWALYASSDLTVAELNEVVALLQPVTVDAWIAAMPYFDN